ncbi:hypothetical protein JW859_01820 [bacterium]|nr:hypothetical protein [bacterium]
MNLTGWQKCIGAAALFALFLAIHSCASSGLDVTEPAAGTPATTESGGWPVLPAGDTPGPARGESMVFGWELAGDDYYAAGEAAVPNLVYHTLQLLPAQQDISWAIYEFTGLAAGDAPQSVNFSLANPRPKLLYFGFPDYEAGMWNWIRVNNPGLDMPFALTNFPYTVSPAGNVYFAVVAWDGWDAVIQRVTLYVDLAAPAPQDVIASDGAFVDHVEISWSPVVDPDYYVVYRDGYAEENIIGTAESDFESFDDYTADNLQYYEYWVQAMFDGELGRLSNSDTGYRSNWERHQVDLSGDVGLYCSVAAIDGKPAVSYYDNDNGRLKYACAITSQPAGQGDWRVHTVDFSASVGELTSLAVLDGKPVISYFDNANGNLKFARALLSEPMTGADWTIHVVDKDGWVGEHSSVAIQDGLPVISYFDYTNTRLLFARALSPEPQAAADWQIHTVDDGDYTGRFTSTAIVDGRPAISYYDDDATCLKYARSLLTLPVAATDWRVYTVDNAGDDGLYSSLIDLDGKPAIAYYDWSAKNVKFARALVADPTLPEQWLITKLDQDGTVCQYPSLALLDGKPLISYYGNTDLRCVIATTAAPTADDWHLFSVDTQGSAGNYSSLTIIDNRPAILYYGNPGLMFATTETPEIEEGD